MFKISKYRNVLGSNVPREEWYEELQLDADRLDLYPIAATSSQFAFPSQLNGGACIEIKPTSDTGKAHAIQKPTSLLKGHTQRVNALAYATYLPSSSTSILASGGDDTTVKLWDTSSSIESSVCLWSFEDAAVNTRVVGLAFHPSASDVLAVAMSKTIAVLNIQRQQAMVPTSFAHPDVITGFTWNYDGSAAATVCQDKLIRVWDPRGDGTVATTKGHQGRKAAAIAWLQPDVFLTAGFNTLQERELMLWDMRKLDKSVGRERVDTGTGLLIPTFDEDTNLLFVAGRGDKIIRTYEINVDKAPAFSPLQATTSSRPAWGVARVPKRACALTSCEVARLLVVEQGNVIEPISYTVPRRDAVNQFQADLYPDSRTSTPALTAADWASRRDAAPLLGAVVPAASGTAGAALHGAIDVANTSWNAGGGWASAAPPPTAILTPDIDAPATQAAPIKFELSEKAKKLGSIQGNKFKYITGKTMTRSESFLNVPSSDAALLVANATHWATAIVGTGGPVLVHPLGSPGKVDHGGIVINCHKLPVTDLEFHPFRPQLLATASDDCSIQLSDYTNPNERVVASLSGHDKGIRCVAFHPSANNVLASGAMDCTIRLWDVGAQTARQVIQKLDDAPWNVSFNFDGTLLATISRDKVLRVIDPRANRTAAMACAHDGAKAQKVLWCAQHLSSSTLVTVGFTARSERQVFLWDARNLLDPVCQTTLDTSGSALLPFYDESANVIYLVSRGDRTVMTYEIDAAAGTVAPCAPFAFTGAPIAGAALLPKQSCNVRDVEVAKFLLLTKATIEPVTLSVPRADKLKPFFQDDIYGVVRTYSTGVSPDAWFRGHDRAPSTESLNRSGMPLLSAREQDVVVAVPNVIEFQAQKDREDHARAVRDQQIQRLHALAAQPTLHHQGAAVHPDDDDDDGWDD